MSYRFHLIAPDAGEQHLSEIDRLRSVPEMKTPPDPAKEERKRRIAAAVRALLPRLEPVRLDFQRIAISRGTTEEQARLSYRHVELDGPKDGSGIHVTLFDDGGMITVPYWHEGTGAAAVFDEVWGCMQIFEREGYRVFDMQAHRWVDVAKDREVALRSYIDVGTPYLPGAPEERRPWWKKLFG